MSDIARIVAADGNRLKPKGPPPERNSTMNEHGFSEDRALGRRKNFERFNRANLLCAQVGHDDSPA
jgi:hypothetical protein